MDASDSASDFPIAEHVLGDGLTAAAVDVFQRDEVLFFKPSGQISFHGAEFRNIVLNAIAASENEAAVDLSQVNRLGSDFFGTVIELHEKLEKRGRCLVLVLPKEGGRIDETISTYGLTRLLATTREASDVERVCRRIKEERRKGDTLGHSSKDGPEKLKLSFTGRICERTKHIFRMPIMDAIEDAAKNGKRLVIDMCLVNCAKSDTEAALEVLRGVKLHAERRGVQLSLVNAPEEIRRGFDSIVVPPVVETRGSQAALPDAKGLGMRTRVSETGGAAGQPPRGRLKN